MERNQIGIRHRGGIARSRTLFLCYEQSEYLLEQRRASVRENHGIRSLNELRHILPSAAQANGITNDQEYTKWSLAVFCFGKEIRSHAKR